MTFISLFPSFWVSIQEETKADFLISFSYISWLSKCFKFASSSMFSWLIASVDEGKSLCMKRINGKQRRNQGKKKTSGRDFSKKECLAIFEWCNSFSWMFRTEHNVPQPVVSEGGPVSSCLSKITQRANTEAKASVSSFTFGHMQFIWSRAKERTRQFACA